MATANAEAPQSELAKKATRKLEELLLQGSKVLLLGAGASKCAGLPLMADLTRETADSEVLSEKSREVLESVRRAFEGAANPNIEDFLSELVDQLAIADRRAMRGAAAAAVSIAGASFERNHLSVAIEEIKTAIHRLIHIRARVEYHRRFVRALHRPTRPGRRAKTQNVDYLILNYDTLIEDALALERVPFSDGFEGGETGWWSPASYSRTDRSARIFKLHGSINWCELKGESLPRRFGQNVDEQAERSIVIWPASTKYRETQFDPYAQLLAYSREALRPTEGRQLILMICGYSFSDAHINVEVDRALRASGGDMTVVAFTEEASPNGQLKIWREDERIGAQLLIFARRGFFHGTTEWLTSEDMHWWKFENVVRILEGEA